MAAPVKPSKKMTLEDYYFVIINYNAGRDIYAEKDIKLIMAFNLTEEKVIKRYLRPYLTNTYFLAQGKRINIERLEEIRIFRKIGKMKGPRSIMKRMYELWKDEGELTKIIDWFDTFIDYDEVTDDILSDEEKATNKYITSVSKSKKKSSAEDKQPTKKIAEKLKSNRSNNLVSSKESITKVFVVHGRNQAMKHEVARTLDQLDLKPIILHEQANQGRTIIEKFTQCSDVNFSVVLLSPDDVAYQKGSKSKKGKLRARQNVILELGYFLGKLGRKNVMALFKETKNFEMPTDFAGVVYTPYDDHGNWKFKLVKELQTCGYNVDANKIL